MFSPSRVEARRFLVESWSKHCAKARLSGLERLAAKLIALHSEYHGVVENPGRFIDCDWQPESGEPNPFLHLSLHLAVAEHLAIDQPPGTRAQFERLRATRGDEHAALHVMLECLGEVVWSAQRHGTLPDATLYLQCLERQRQVRVAIVEARNKAPAGALSF